MATERKYLSLEKLGLYDEKLKAKMKADIAAAKSGAEAYADSLATNYDAAGAAATVQGKLDTEIARAKAAEEANAAAAKQAQDEVDALELVVKQIQENAYDDTEIRGLISGLDTNKADKTQVATDIAAAVKVETDARVEAVAGVQGAVDALSGTHATDKKALEDAIALKADQTALDAVSGVANAAVKQSDYDTKVAALEAEDTRIAGLVATEKERAEGAESELNERLEEVEAFFKLAEGETLDTALDTLKEIQTYITGEGAAADQMVLDIAANAKAITDMDTAYKAADVTLQGNIDSLSGVVDTKAAQADLEELEGRVEVVEGAVATKVEQEAYNAKVTALEEADAGQVERIAALEGKFGGAEGSVEDLIADAKQEAISTAAGDATTKANTAEGNAKTYADGLNTAMNTRVEALEAVDHEHSNKALLDSYTQTEANLADAVAKKHAHGNADVLDGITAEKVTAWDTVGSKASQTDLSNAVDRIAANEAAIAAFVEISEGEINALFAE